jgi:urea carboxylase system permease
MTAPIADPRPTGSHEADVADLAQHGYAQRLNRSLGSFSSFAAGFSYISILTGMFQLFGFGYGFGGPLFFWSWIVVFAGQFCVALMFAELSARFPIAGSVYQWSKKVGGRANSWMAGWTMLVGSIVTVAAVAIAWQIVLPNIWSKLQFFSSGDDAADYVHNAVLLGSVLIIITTIINVLGVKVMAKINNVGVLAELIGVAIILVLLLVHARRGPQVVFHSHGAGPGLPGYDTLGVLVPLLMGAVMPAYVMFGFDTAGSLAEETKDPRKTTPKALLQALAAAGFSGLLLLLFALMASKDLALDKLGVGGLPSVLDDALGSNGSKLVLIDVAIAIFVCCLAIHAAAIRIAFSMARDHALPLGEGLSHVSEHRHAPAAPALVSGAVAILILLVNVGNSKLFLVVTSVSIILVYIAYLMVTVPTFLRRRAGWPEDEGRTGLFTLPKPWGVVINVAAIAYGFLMALNLIWPRHEIYGAGNYQWGGVLAVGVVLVVGLGYYYGVQQNKPDRIVEEHRVLSASGADTDTGGT